MKNMLYLHMIEVLLVSALTIIFGTPNTKLLLVAIFVVLSSDVENVILRNKRNI